MSWWLRGLGRRVSIFLLKYPVSRERNVRDIYSAIGPSYLDLRGGDRRVVIRRNELATRSFLVLRLRACKAVHRLFAHAVVAISVERYVVD